MIHVSLLCRKLVFSGIVLAILAWVVEPSVGRAAESAEETGFRIATEARERQKGFGNFTANLTMVLRNKQGRESRRELHLKVIEVDGDGDRTLFVFDRPATSREPRFSSTPTRTSRTNSGSIFPP